MITLRKFFVGLLALTALVVIVVAAYSVYEMTPERRARRVASRLERLGDEFFEDPEMEIRYEYYRKRGRELAEDLFDVACYCEPPFDGSGPSGPFLGPPLAGSTGPVRVFWWRRSGSHKEGCLYSELIKEVSGYWWELNRKRESEMVRWAVEESRR